MKGRSGAAMGWLRGLLGSLDGYWFGEGSYRDLAIARMVIVGGHLIFFYPDLTRQLAYAAGDPEAFLALPALKVLLLPLGEWGIRPEATLIHAVWLVGIVAGVAGVLGKYTRLSLFVHAAATTFLWAHYYSYGTVHHTSSLLVIALWTLAVAPSGRALSLDDLARRTRTAMDRGRFVPRLPRDEWGPLARWPLVLIQWVLALSYFSAGMSKVVFGGMDWFHSANLTFYMVQDSVRQGVSLGLVAAQFPQLLTAAAVVTVLFELTFVIAILVPRTAWAFLIVGFGMHVSIHLTMGAPFLSWTLLYIAFLPSLRETAGALAVRLRRWRPAEAGTPGRRWVVVFDGYCTLCIRTMTILDYLDVGNRLEPIDCERDWARAIERVPTLTLERARHAIQVSTPDGRTVEGFHAARELGRAVPALWILLPVLYAPGSGLIGPRVYGAIAARRGRAGSCSADGCRVSPEVLGLPAQNSFENDTSL